MLSTPRWAFIMPTGPAFVGSICTRWRAFVGATAARCWVGVLAVRLLPANVGRLTWFCSTLVPGLCASHGRRGGVLGLFIITLKALAPQALGFAAAYLCPCALLPADRAGTFGLGRSAPRAACHAHRPGIGWCVSLSHGP